MDYVCAPLPVAGPTRKLDCTRFSVFFPCLNEDGGAERYHFLLWSTPPHQKGIPTLVEKKLSHNVCRYSHNPRKKPSSTDFGAKCGLCGCNGFAADNRGLKNRRQARYQRIINGLRGSAESAPNERGCVCIINKHGYCKFAQCSSQKAA